MGVLKWKSTAVCLQNEKNLKSKVALMPHSSISRNLASRNLRDFRGKFECLTSSIYKKNPNFLAEVVLEPGTSCVIDQRFTDKAIVPLT